MSSTQGHTNINTVHTTIDISVLLGEINRIADDSFLNGVKQGYDKGKADGAREFAEWLAECEKISEPIKEYTINRWLEDFAEWQKGAENGKITYR